MSCSRWLSIQSSLALATPVDSHCVSQELRRFDAIKMSILSIPFSTRASLPGSRQIQRALRQRCLTSVSQLVWPSDELGDAACSVTASVAWLPDKAGPSFFFTSSILCCLLSTFHLTLFPGRPTPLCVERVVVQRSNLVFGTSKQAQGISSDRTQAVFVSPVDEVLSGCGRRNRRRFRGQTKVNAFWA